MTDETLNTQTETLETLSTREIMEQNWDRFIASDAEMAEGEGSASLAVNQDSNTLEPKEAIDPDFDPKALIDENYETIQNLLDEQDKTTKEKWLQNLFNLEKLYHQEPLKAVRLMLQDYLKKKGISMEQLSQNTPYPMGAFKGVPFQQTGLENIHQNQRVTGVMPQLAYQNLAQGMHQIPSHPNGQNGSCMENRAQPQPVYQPPVYPVAPMPQNLYGARAEIPFAFAPNPNGTESLSKSDVQTLIKQGVEDYFKTKTEESQKAKTASFTPKGTAQKIQPSQTHTSTGRLKTTREILEEGCKMFGI